MLKVFVCLVALAAIVSCQLFSDNLLIKNNAFKGNNFQKTINFDNVKTSGKDSRGYLPPEPYLPPTEPEPLPNKIVPQPGPTKATPRPPGPPRSTPGPRYLPVEKVTLTTRLITYMPVTGTFPPIRNYTYPTYQTTTYKPRPAPSRLPRITTTPRPTTAYNYDSPDQAFTAEDILRPQFG